MRDKGKKDIENKKTKKTNKLLKVVLGLVLTIVILISSFYVTAHYFLSKMEREELGEINISQELINNKKNTDVINIALFGVDARTDTYDNTRSDAMMVLSYNKKTKEGFITSIVRDSYVYIDDEYGYQKINHSYAYGGPRLAVQTINQNFDLDIDKYVSVNFNAVEHIINSLGGVEVEIKDYELTELNRIIEAMNNENTLAPTSLVKGTGIQTLNGKQAISYMRIRKVGNGDYERMERQRHIMMLTLEKVLTYNKVKLIGLVDDLLPYVKTNISSTEIISLGTQILFGGNLNVEQLQLPNTDLAWGGTLSDSLYYLVPRTLENNVIEWHNSVYGINDYNPTSIVDKISAEIISTTGVK